MKWPEKVKRFSRLFKANFELADADEVVSDQVIYRTIITHNKSSKTIGKIILPLGWQDMDRTWTFQDIYWEDKYDCLNERRGAVPINKLLENERL